MLASLASLDDLDELVGGIPADQQLRAGRNLLHASVVVRHAAGDPSGWAEDDDDPDFPVAVDVPDALVMITLEAAKRRYENPRGRASEQLGDHAYTVAGGGGVYLTNEERVIAAGYNPSGVADNSSVTIQAHPYYLKRLRQDYGPLWGT